MKKWMFSLLMVFMMLLAACTPRIYGVPEDRWETMSEQERIAAMEAYKARQEALRQKREEQARLRAMEKEARLAREAEEARQRQMRVDAIYRGEGLYGELLRVNLKGGLLEFHGVHKPFRPVSFRIAAGEMKDVEIVSVHGRKARMAVYYDGSNLLLDESPKSRRSTAIRLPYEDSWEAGATYPHLAAKGPLEIRGVDVTVRIIGKPPRRPHARPRWPHGAVAPPVQNPQRPAVVVIKEPERHPKPKVVVINRRPEIEEREVVVVKPLPGEDKHGKIISHRPSKRDAVLSQRPAVIVVKEPDSHAKPDGTVVEQRPQAKEPAVLAALKTHPGEDNHGEVVVHDGNNRDAVSVPPDRVKVVFRKGRFFAKKGGDSLVPQTIDLSDGQSRDVVIRGRKGKLKIRVSYSGGELVIDDTPGNGRRCTRLGFVPGWEKGQGYAVAASGNGRLKDLDIMIVSQ